MTVATSHAFQPFAQAVKLPKLAYDVSRRTMVAFGGLGRSTSVTVYSDVDTVRELPSSSAGDWIERLPVPASPTNRLYADMTFDAARGQMVLFGGYAGIGTLGDTWTFDGATWSNRGSGYAAPRAQTALACEPSLGVVMFGGATATGACYGDTLFWNGVGWYPSIGSGAPAARMGHDMVADTANGRIVMFGGYNGTTLADTWQLRLTSWGYQWSQLAPFGWPAARRNHAMAYDARRHSVVMFGGADASGQFLGDTWELVFQQPLGLQWLHRYPAQSPPRRWGHSMAYDEARRVVVLTGGYGNPQCGNGCASFLDDVWEYDGVTWRQRARPTSTLPFAREGAAFAWDPLHERCVLQGGGANGGYWPDTWYYDAPLDRVAMAGADGTLRCTRFPAAGSTVTFSFPTDYGYGWLLFAASTSTGVAVPVWAGSLCSAGSLIAYPDTLYAAMGQPSTASFNVPAALAGHSFSAQGMWYDTNGCFGVTDALVVTVRAP